MPAGDVYILSNRQLLNGVQVVNNFALRWDGAGDPAAANFATIATSFAASLKVYQVDDLTYTDWYALKVYGSGVTYQTSAPFRVSTVAFTGAYTSAQAGSLTSPPEPGNVAIVIALNTGQAGRRRRGRLFLGGISEVFIDDDGTLNATQLANVQAQVNALVGLYGASGSNTDWTWGVWSDRIATNTQLSNTWPRVQTSMGPPDPANAFLGIVSGTVRDYVGSQRDRRAGI